jgi:hypothetical protein
MYPWVQLLFTVELEGKRNIRLVQNAVQRVAAYITSEIEPK